MIMPNLKGEVMKQYLVFGIFLFASRRKKTTAKEIADNFEISQRSVYRYIDALSMAGVPIMTECGKNGGISIDPNFTLENLILSQKEKDCIKNFYKTNFMAENVKQILQKISV